jgi:hypothetical protein
MPSILSCVQISINADQPDHILDVSWKTNGHHARLVADMKTKAFHIYGSHAGDGGKMRCVSPKANHSNGASG